MKLYRKCIKWEIKENLLLLAPSPAPTLPHPCSPQYPPPPTSSPIDDSFNLTMLASTGQALRLRYVISDHPGDGFSSFFYLLDHHTMYGYFQIFLYTFKTQLWDLDFTLFTKFCKKKSPFQFFIRLPTHFYPLNLWTFMKNYFDDLWRICIQ